jgi:hypothetical protein
LNGKSRKEEVLMRQSVKTSKLPGSLTASSLELIAAINIGLLIVYVALGNVFPVAMTGVEIALSIGGSLSCFAFAAIIRSIHEVVKELREANSKQKLSLQEDRK